MCVFSLSIEPQSLLSLNESKHKITELEYQFESLLSILLIFSGELPCLLFPFDVFCYVRKNNIQVLKNGLFMSWILFLC